MLAQDFARRVRVFLPDHDLPGATCPHAFTRSSPAIGEFVQALDPGTAQQAAKELGFGLGRDDFHYDEVVLGQSSGRLGSSRTRARPLEEPPQQHD